MVARRRNSRTALRSITEELTVNLTDRVAIVTGAAQGIGAVYAKYLAFAGCRTVIADINDSLGRKVEQELNRSGGSTEFVSVDVANEKSVCRAVSSIAERHGRIDILVNNAALCSGLTKKPFDQIEIDEWRRVIQVNVDGTFLMTKAVMPYMRRASYGRIINISSTAVPLGCASHLHYVTSKAAVLGITRSVAREVGDVGVTVNAIMPTVTETEVKIQVGHETALDHIVERQSIKRTGQPEDLARALLFLVSKDSHFITGQTIVVDGGGIHL